VAGVLVAVFINRAMLARPQGNNAVVVVLVVVSSLAVAGEPGAARTSFIRCA
jgi:hypothetical protein